MTGMRSDVLRAIVAFMVPFMVLILVFALLGLTSIGYQVVAVAAGFATMAYFLSRHSDETRTHRQ